MVYQFTVLGSILVYQKKTAKKTKKTKRGRPRRPGGRDPILALRVSKAIIAAIDARAKREGVTRSKMAAAILAEAVEQPILDAAIDR